jgi:hypothetical protein
VSRLPRKGHPRYDVIYADRAARQIGGLMLLFGFAGLMLMIGLRQTEWLVIAGVFCLLTIGGTFFVLGEMLRRRPRLGPAYGLVSVSGTCVGASLMFNAVALVLSPGASPFICPSVFGFALTLPVLWHTLAAIRAMRQSPEQGELGFQVLPPLVPRAASPVTDTQRSDSSR